MTLFTSYQQRKEQLLEHMRRLAAFADQLGMSTLTKDLLEVRIPKLSDDRFHLVVLGEFNRGKSTFVNALLGKEILPTGVTPTTATINHVMWSKKAAAYAITKDGKKTTIPLDGLADWVAVEGKNLADVKYVELTYPADVLKNNVVFIDTPGVNDLNEQRAEITYDYVPRADAVLFLLDAGQALTESERSFLATRVLERSRDRMVFVLTKVDLLDKEEVHEVMTYVANHLAQIIDEAPLFAVSAKRHLAGKDGGIQALLDHLNQRIVVDRGRIMMDNATGDAILSAAYLKQNLGVKLHALALSLDDLEERVSRVRQQLDATSKSLREVHKRIAAEAQAVKAQIRLDLEQFVERFLEVLPAQIDAADGGDIKRYLPLFVQDKFKEWAELEGESVGLLLERFTEEIIAITNENVRQTATELADRLGPSDAPLEVDVDSFKYDVSIYAVGALGTTVFLFVNTLVGGLLTLATPILAIVLQSKIDAEIKDIAKKRAPAAIKKAQATIEPHFVRIVDEFTMRLDDFVTSAGDKLYRGIGEVLDRAIEERRGSDDRAAPAAADVEKQLGELVQLDAKLKALRDDLWATTEK